MRKLLAGLVKARAVIAALVPIAALTVPADKLAHLVDITAQAGTVLQTVAGVVGALAAALMTAPKDHQP